MTTSPKPCHCDEAKQNMWLFLDAEVEYVDCGRIQQHLDECPECSAAIAAEEQLRDALRRSCAERAPEALRMIITERISVIRSSQD